MKLWLFFGIDLVKIFLVGCNVSVIENRKKVVYHSTLPGREDSLSLLISGFSSPRPTWEGRQIQIPRKIWQGLNIYNIQY